MTTLKELGWATLIIGVGFVLSFQPGYIDLAGDAIGWTFKDIEYTELSDGSIVELYGLFLFGMGWIFPLLWTKWNNFKTS